MVGTKGVCKPSIIISRIGKAEKQKKFIEPYKFVGLEFILGQEEKSFVPPLSEKGSKIVPKQINVRFGCESRICKAHFVFCCKSIMDKILTITIKIKSESPKHVRFLNANF